MAWSKGQPWRVVRSLNRLNEQIRAGYPRAVPPATPVTSWGAIADDAHNSSSDHYPHYYSALGKTAVVCARDFPHAPAAGLNAHALADRLRASRDPRIGYIISNGRITGPAHRWRWDDYNGSDPHDTHIHVSSVHTAAADDRRDWQIGEDDMTPDELRRADIWQNPYPDRATNPKMTMESFVRNVGGDTYGTKLAVARVESQVAALRAELAAVAGRDPFNEQQVIDGVLAGLAGVDLDSAAAALRAAFGDRTDELAARLQG